jgi:hypothetical protein
MDQKLWSMELGAAPLCIVSDRNLDLDLFALTPHDWLRWKLVNKKAPSICAAYIQQ